MRRDEMKVKEERRGNIKEVARGRESGERK